MILAIGDAHFPFSADLVVKWIIYSVLKNNPQITHVIQMGDLYDLMSYSRFPKRLILTPRDETNLARHKAESFWRAIKKVSPGAKLIQLLGNHDERLSKRVIETMPELDHLIRYQDLWAFEGVHTINDPKSPYIIGNWAFTHGFTKYGGHLTALQFRYNVCTAHIHRGGQHLFRFPGPKGDVILQELNAGYCADPFHEALVYRPQNKFFNWTWGCALIDENGGRFIPFPGRKNAIKQITSS